MGSLLHKEEKERCIIQEGCDLKEDCQNISSVVGQIMRSSSLFALFVDSPISEQKSWKHEQRKNEATGTVGSKHIVVFCLDRQEGAER